MQIGTVLKKIRMVHSINANELAPQLCISPSYLSEIEHNKKVPSLELLEQYSEIFDIKTSSIILMAEDYQENTENKKSELFIQKRMLNLLNKFSLYNEADDND